MAEIAAKYLDLFQKKAFAQLATLMPDGSPHVSPVWCDYDGEHVIINSAKGRVKDRNMRRDPRVGLDIQDPDNPYRHLSIRGRVVSVDEKGADENIVLDRQRRERAHDLKRARQPTCCARMDGKRGDVLSR